MSVLAPRNDGQLILQLHQRLQTLEQGSTTRVGDWVLADKGGKLTATSSTASTVLSAVPDFASLINAAITGAVSKGGFISATDLANALKLQGPATDLSSLDAVLTALEKWVAGLAQINPLSIALTGIGGGLAHLEAWALSIPHLVSGFLSSLIIPGLDASKIISGVLSGGLIPFLDAAIIHTGTFLSTLIPGLDASKIITGVLSGSLIPNLNAAIITAGTFVTSLIPGLDVSKITSGVFGTGFIPGLDVSKITSGVFGSGFIPGLDASKIVSGVLSGSLIPDITAAASTDIQKLIDGAYQAVHGGSSTGNVVTTFKTSLLNIPGANVISAVLASIIPSLDASKVTTGIFGTGLIPGLDVSKIITGVFGSGFIPGLDASKIITGVFSTGLIPNITAAMSTDVQAIVDGAYQAVHGGSSTSNAVSTFKTSLLNIPGANIISSVLASIIPSLDASKVTTGVFGTGLIPSLAASIITSGTFATGLIPNITKAMSTDMQSVITNIFGTSSIGTVLQAPAIPGLDVSKIISGVFGTGFIPSLDASKVTTGIFGTGLIPGLDVSKIVSGIFGSGFIPSLDASKVTTGIFGTGLIPGLDVAKIITGVFGSGFIPGLDASKIITGTFANSFSPGLLPQSLWQSSTTVGKNLVISPQFEDSTIPRTTLTGATASVTYSTAVARSGTQSIAFVTSNAISGQSDLFYLSPNSLGNENTDPIASSTKVQPGQWIYGEVYVRAKATNTTTAGFVVLSGFIRDSTGVNPLSLMSINFVNLSGLSSSAWTKISGWFQIPAGYDLIQPFAWIESQNVINQTVYWDDVRIVEETVSQSIIQQLFGGSSVLSNILSTVVPGLDASKIITGVLSGSLIPNLNAAIITAGTFVTSLIPGLDASKIITGLFSQAHIPSLSSGGGYTGSIDGGVLSGLATGIGTWLTSGGSLPSATRAVISQVLDGSANPLTGYLSNLNFGGIMQGTGITSIFGTPTTVVTVHPPTFDAVGGNPAFVNPGSWSHTLAANATALVVAVDWWDFTSGMTAPTAVVTVGGTPMTLLGTAIGYSAPGTLFIGTSLYGLINPPTGTRTITVTFSDGTTDGVGGSLSYTGATGFGTFASNTYLVSVAATLSVPSAPNQIVAQAFGGWVYNLSAYNQTQRINDPYGAGLAFIMGDAPGATIVNFTCSQATSSIWAGVAIPVIGTSTTTSNNVSLAGDVQSLVTQVAQAWGGIGSGFNAGDLATLATNILPTFVGGTLGGANIGATIANIVDTGVQAIIGGASTGNSLGVFGNVLNALTGHVGFTQNGAPAPASSITSITQTNAGVIANRAVTKPMYVGIDQSADAVFPWSSLAGASLPTINVTQGNSVIGIIGTPDAGIKESVEFYGAYTGVINEMYINLCQVNISSLYGIQQLIQITGTPTSFTLTFNGQTTAAITYATATASVIQQALSLLTTIGFGNVSVSGGNGVFVVTFINAMGVVEQNSLSGSTSGGGAIGITVATAGQVTRLWSSANLMVSPGVGAGFGWNFANLPMSQFVSSSQGGVYAVEMQVYGTGTYTIVGQTHQALNHPQAIPPSMGGTRTNLRKLYSAAASGFNASAATTKTVTHPAVAGDTIIIACVDAFSATALTTAPYITATCGGTAMTQVGFSTYFTAAGTFCYAAIFALVGTFSGNTNIVVTGGAGMSGGGFNIATVSYPNVTGWGTAQVATPATVLTMSQALIGSITTPTLVVQQTNNASAVAWAAAPANMEPVAVLTGGSFCDGILVQDAYVSGNPTFTATVSGATAEPMGAIALPLFGNAALNPVMPPTVSYYSGWGDLVQDNGSVLTAGHHFVTGDNAVMLAVSIYSATAITSVAATCGGTAMTQNSLVGITSHGFNYLAVFSLVGTAGVAPFTGTNQPVVVTVTGGSNIGMSFESISYPHVSSIGTAQTASGTSASCTQTTTGISVSTLLFNAMLAVPQFFSASNRETISGFNTQAVGGYSLLINDFYSASNIAFTAPLSASCPWQSVIVPITVSGYAPNTVPPQMVPLYNGNMPWFGLTATPGVSQFNAGGVPDAAGDGGGVATAPATVAPVTLDFWGTGTVVITNPAVQFPWANWFDIITCSAGGGAESGGTLQGSIGANPGIWSAYTASAAAMGTSNVTVNNGAGGAGGVGTSGAGGTGGTSSVVIPGLGTVGATGGTTRIGASGSAYGVGGINAAGFTWNDVYGNAQNFGGGAGGATPGAAGQQPGGGGAGGSSTGYFGIYGKSTGGAGGPGFVRIRAYQ